MFLRVRILFIRSSKCLNSDPTQPLVRHRFRRLPNASLRAQANRSKGLHRGHHGKDRARDVIDFLKAASFTFKPTILATPRACYFKSQDDRSRKFV